ncbi:MAG: hypothetical protein OEV64_05105, partial [Desulfobulbaceae bacterium]|nr:hypothetical protein [Desulfobulbaceae bacterium]
MNEKLKSALFIFLISCFSIISVSAGIFIVPQLGEGFWSLTWKRVEGQWVEGDNVYRFRLMDSTAAPREYTGRRISVWKGGRDHRDMDNIFEKAVDRSLWRGQILTVFVHPFQPERSVLRSGVPPQTVLLLLISLAAFVPTSILWRQWLQKKPTGESMIWSLKAALFFVLSYVPAVAWVELNSNLLRTMPLTWPFWLFIVISVPLWLQPEFARLLYGFNTVRRFLY